MYLLEHYNVHVLWLASSTVDTLWRRKWRLYRVYNEILMSNVGVGLGTDRVLNFRVMVAGVGLHTVDCGIPDRWIGFENNGAAHPIFTKLVGPFGINSKPRNFKGIHIRCKEKYFIIRAVRKKF